VHRNEWPRPGRTLGLILDTCAAGKSTLNRVSCGEGGLERTAEFDYGPAQKEVGHLWTASSRTTA